MRLQAIKNESWGRPGNKASYKLSFYSTEYIQPLSTTVDYVERPVYSNIV